MSELTYQLELRFFRGAPVEKKHPVSEIAKSSFSKELNRQQIVSTKPPFLSSLWWLNHVLASWTGWTSVQPFWYPLLFPPEQLGFFLQLVTLLIWFQLMSFVAQLKLQSSMLSWAKSRKLAVFPHAIGINEHKRHIWRLLIESFIPYAMQSVHLWLTDWSTDLLRFFYFLSPAAAAVAAAVAINS